MNTDLRHCYYTILGNGGREEAATLTCGITCLEAKQVTLQLSTHLVKALRTRTLCMDKIMHMTLINTFHLF